MRHATARHRRKALARVLAAAVVYGVGLLLIAGITAIGVGAVWVLWGVLGVR